MLSLYFSTEIYGRLLIVYLHRERKSHVNRIQSIINTK